MPTVAAHVDPIGKIDLDSGDRNTVERVRVGESSSADVPEGCDSRGIRALAKLRSVQA